MPGVTEVISQYQAYGPLAASFLSNLLATFGDKGQLVVIVLASRYDPKRVFLGATAAFALWSGLEVIFGAWITSVLPGSVMTFLTGALFVAFGVWTLLGVAGQSPGETGVATLVDGTRTDGFGGIVDDSRYLPARLQTLSAQGPIVTSFLFILLAEFGDKTQLLTINLAATFPESPVLVFVGVMAALALRTGVDAVIGGRARQYLPARFIQVVAAVVFVAFGLAVFGLIPPSVLLAIVTISVLAAVTASVWLAMH